MRVTGLTNEKSRFDAALAMLGSVEKSDNEEDGVCEVVAVEQIARNKVEVTGWEVAYTLGRGGEL